MLQIDTMLKSAESFWNDFSVIASNDSVRTLKTLYSIELRVTYPTILNLYKLLVSVRVSNGGSLGGNPIK